MIAQTNQLFLLSYNHSLFYAFVFCATLCSYNFHWYLTPYVPSSSYRIAWNHQNRSTILYIYLITAICSLYLGWQLRHHWMAISLGIVATFLYTAPKIPHKYFSLLSKIAFGKTLFLTFVWMYVTTALPILISDSNWTFNHSLFCISRFTLIYAICILFDYRDRESDQASGVKSMITWLSEQKVLWIFILSLLLFFISTIAMSGGPFSVFTKILLLVPGAIVWLLYRYSKKHSGDYLYYFVLDGLMMFSSILTLLFRF